MDPTSPARTAPALLVVAVVVLTLTAGAAIAYAAEVFAGSSPRPAKIGQRALVADRLEVRAAHLLTAWDRDRAQAWAADDAVALRALYVERSSAGRRDVEMLRAWRRRGVRVEGLRTQLVGVRVLAHRPGRFQLEVVDRVAAGSAVGVGTGVRRALPRDAPSTRRLVLIERASGWRVDSVRRVSSPAPSAAPP